MRLIIVSLLIGSLVIPSSVQAHPGRTDSSGGHTCWTKCEQWGLKSGEYHKHSASTTEKKAKTKAKTKAK